MSTIAYYCFDVADEIALERLEKILGKRPVEARLEVKKLAPKYIQYKTSPYEFNLGVRKIALDKEHEVEARTTAKLYSFGAVNSSSRFPCNATSPSSRRLRTA